MSRRFSFSPEDVFANKKRQIMAEALDQRQEFSVAIAIKTEQKSKMDEIKEEGKIIEEDPFDQFASTIAAGLESLSTDEGTATRNTIVYRLFQLRNAFQAKPEYAEAFTDLALWLDSKVVLMVPPPPLPDTLGVSPSSPSFSQG